MKRRQKGAPTIPAGIRLFLTTGQWPPPDLDEGWDLFFAYYGDQCQAMTAAQRRIAFEPYRAQLRAEGLALPRIPELDDANADA